MLYLSSLFPGLWLEIVMAHLSRSCPEYRYFWWQTGRVRRIDLLAAGGTERIGICVCGGHVPQPRDLIPLDRAYEKRLIDRGCLLYPGRQAFAVSRVLQVLPLYGRDALTLPLKYCTVPHSGTYRW